MADVIHAFSQVNNADLIHPANAIIDLLNKINNKQKIQNEQQRNNTPGASGRSSAGIN